MKKFFLYCGYDILIMGADENREVEIEEKYVKKQTKFYDYLKERNWEQY
jgi:hypothetical protein